jgi:guanylate kinase
VSISTSISNEQSLKKKLLQKNPYLCPAKLADFFPAYHNFKRNTDHFGIWQKSNFKQQLSQNKNRYSKILLLLSGVAGGGKDAIREKITQLHNDAIFKIITATSRQPRPGEQHGVDYYFYESKDKFKQAIKKNELLEWVAQGDRLYGLPKISLNYALKRPEPIIVTHVEMTAWPKVSQFIQQEVEDKPFILRVFAMPQMSYSKYAHEWLPTQRNDYQARLSRTLWELDQAPQLADFLISNHIDRFVPFLQWQTQSLLDLIRKILTPEAREKFY